MSGPLPGYLAPLTVPLSFGFGLAVRRRNRRFDRGIGVVRLDRPVISIGNLTTGGTGKSPAVAWIADQLRALDHHPVIAMRGYKSPSGEPGDEEAEYAERLPDVPVLANPDRAGALRNWLPRHPDIDCILLDDGFQHRRVARDLDVVLIDAERPELGERLLPAGHLREPPSSLARADAVVVTRAFGIDDGLSARIERHHGKPPLAWSRHAWTGVRVFDPGAGEAAEPTAWLEGRRVVTMLGVGHPRSVQRQLERAGAQVVAAVPARDHEAYDRAKLAMARGFCDGADALVVTAKDWVKIRRLLDWRSWPSAIAVPTLKLDVFAGAGDLVNLLRQAVESDA